MMRRIRCHVDLELATGQTLALPDEVRNHLARVLRLREGDGVDLFNGDGCDYQARLVGAGRQMGARILAADAPAAAEPGLQVTLVQGLARGEKMDWIIQKATEIGVSRIVPVSCQRSTLRLTGERAEKRLEHWRRVVTSACEQCGRARIPTIEAVQPLATAAAGISGVGLVLDPEAADGPRALLPDLAGELALAIGPEGGFDQHEMAMLHGLGWRGLRLGARILRTETAAIVAMSALFTLADEF